MPLTDQVTGKSQMPQGAEESSELPALELGLPVVDMLQVVVGGQGRNVLREVWRGRGSGLVRMSEQDTKNVTSKI
jgi:hypothetical protein